MSSESGPRVWGGGGGGLSSATPHQQTDTMFCSQTNAARPVCQLASKSSDVDNIRQLDCGTANGAVGRARRAGLGGRGSLAAGIWTPQDILCWK